MRFSCGLGYYWTRRSIFFFILLVTGILVIAATKISKLGVEDVSSSTFTKEGTGTGSGMTNWVSLEDFYREHILPFMPPPGYEYNIPTFQTLRDMEHIVYNMMHLTLSSHDFRKRCSSIDLLSLKDVYEIDVLEDVKLGHRYCVLMTTSRDFPWGTVVVNPSSASHFRRNLSLDCPHPLHDINTGEQAVALFQGTNARSLVLSGVYRYASNETSCQGGSYRISDAAHSLQHGFHAAVTAIAKYYQRENAIDFTSIQFHGMGSSTCQGVDAYLTHGLAAVTSVPNEKLYILWRKIIASFTNIKNDTFVLLPSNGISIHPNPLTLSCSMSGSSNLQGRLLNGVPPDRVCDTAASSVSGRFIHLEQKPWLRDPSLFPTWIEVVKQAHDEFLTLFPIPETLSMTGVYGPSNKTIEGPFH